MARTPSLVPTIATLLLCAGAASASPPTICIIGMGPGDISADGLTVCGPIYDAALQKSIVYQYTRGVGALRTEGIFTDGTVNCSADASAMAWGSYDAENLSGAGTSANTAHRWTMGTGLVNLGMTPGGFSCGSAVNTPYDISGNGRYVVGGEYTGRACGPFRAFRYDAQDTVWETLPVSISAPPLSLPANATRANGCSFDGSVVGGYDQNYDPTLAYRSRHAAVWVKIGATWAETVLDWYGGEIYAVSSDGNTVVGDMSSTTMMSTFGTTVTTPVRWVRSGSNWIPHNMGGSSSMSPVAVSADGGTVVGMGGSGFIWRESINGGVAMDLGAYVASQGGAFPGFTISSPAGTPVWAVSADGNAVVVMGVDSRNPCLSTYAAAILYLNGTTCEPPGVNFNPVSQYDPAGPTNYGMIMNTFATGTWPLNYQWQRETSPGSGVWNDLTDDNCGLPNAANYNFRGTTTSQLRLGALDGVWSGRYRCVVTDECGSVTSGAATAAVCHADYNCDGFMDGLDYDQFNADYESYDPAQQIRADYNSDGFVDGLDYDLFNADFETGC